VIDPMIADSEPSPGFVVGAEMRGLAIPGLDGDVDFYGERPQPFSIRDCIVRTGHEQGCFNARRNCPVTGGFVQVGRFFLPSPLNVGKNAHYCATTNEGVCSRPAKAVILERTRITALLRTPPRRGHTSVTCGGLAISSSGRDTGDTGHSPVTEPLRGRFFARIFRKAMSGDVVFRPLRARWGGGDSWRGIRGTRSRTKTYRVMSPEFHVAPTGLDCLFVLVPRVAPGSCRADPGLFYYALSGRN